MNRHPLPAGRHAGRDHAVVLLLSLLVLCGASVLAFQGPDPRPSGLEMLVLAQELTATAEYTATFTVVPGTPTPTATGSPTPTPEPGFDPSTGEHIACNGVYQGNTTGQPNLVSSYPCRPQWDESGPERLYILQKTTQGDIGVSIEALDPMDDMDVFLLTSPYPSSCIAAVESSTVWSNLPAGTYYLVVDGYQGAAGAYRLTLHCPGEPTPTATPTSTPQFSYYPLAFRPKPATPTPTPTLTPTPQPYSRGVNCGGTDYLASDGQLYQSDRPYTAGGWGWVGGQPDYVTTTTVDIVDTIDDPIYQNQRYAIEAYRFDVHPGRYWVYLRFAEIFPFIKVGQRVFNVQLEGTTYINQLDLLAKGARNKAYNQEFYVNVTDGRLDIAFIAVTEEYGPVINAIWVERVGEPLTPAPPIP